MESIKLITLLNTFLNDKDYLHSNRLLDLSIVDEKVGGIIISYIFLNDEYYLSDIKHLIEHGANINYQENDNFNCLYSAYYTEDITLIDELLKLGANPNTIESFEKESLLDWANFERWYIGEICNESIDFIDSYIELLIKYGAKSYSDITR